MRRTTKEFWQLVDEIQAAKRNGQVPLFEAVEEVYAASDAHAAMFDASRYLQYRGSTFADFYNWWRVLEDLCKRCGHEISLISRTTIRLLKALVCALVYTIGFQVVVVVMVCMAGLESGWRFIRPHNAS